VSVPFCIFQVATRILSVPVPVFFGGSGGENEAPSYLSLAILEKGGD
jgi:hypothetical protein